MCNLGSLGPGLAILWVAEVRLREGRRSNTSILQGVKAGSEGREVRAGR